MSDNAAYYNVTYAIRYSDGRPDKVNSFKYPNYHPREDMLIRQIIKLEPDLAEQAEYLTVKIDLNNFASIGYNPAFGFDRPSLQAFIRQIS